MKTQDNASSTAQPWLLSRDILTDAGLLGSLSLLGPRVEAPQRDTSDSTQVVLFVSQGSVTVTVGLANFILREEETLRIAPSKSYTVRNHTDAPAKVFALSAPIPRPARPPLVVL